MTPSPIKRPPIPRPFPTPAGRAPFAFPVAAGAEVEEDGRTTVLEEEADGAITTRTNAFLNAMD